MENLFDSIQASVFSVVSGTMGYTASWVPSNNAPEQTARILFKDASETSKVLQMEYDPQRAIMEYYRGSFEGLKSAVDGRDDEYISVSGIKYVVDDIEVKSDGKTFFAHLRKA
jgi:hypothetical protein